MDHRVTLRALERATRGGAIAALLLVQSAFAATAEAGERAPVPAITITEVGLAPGDAVTGSGHAFVFESEVAAPVEVAFALGAGQRVACAPRGRTPRLGQVFTLAPGAQLVCHAMPGRYGFSAGSAPRLATGSSAPDRLVGWIEIS